MKKLFILTNIPVPYKVDFYNELGKKVKLTVVFEGRRLVQQKFNWNDNENLNFEVYYLSEVLNERKIHFEVSKFLIKNRYDDFLISAYHTLTGQFALWVLKFRGISYCFETDGAFIPLKENSLKRLYKKKLISGARKYFSPCEMTDRYLINYGAEFERIMRYPFSSTLESEVLKSPLANEYKYSIRHKLGIHEEKVLIAVGQFIKRKGFDVLLNSLPYLSNTNWGCYIVGGKSISEYNEILESNGLRDKVHFLDFLDREKLALYYRASDLFVLPTREDIWGLVVNEAMANGLPVITTEHCNAGLAMVSNQNGILVPIDDVKALGYAINDILFNDSKLYSMSKASLDIVKKYTIEEMAKVHYQKIFMQ